MTSMRLEYECVDALPRLAWCADVVEGSDVVRIVHGPWVEIWPYAFCEGAWDGPFEEAGFAEAPTFVGTGGRIVDDGILFATPTHLMERLYSVRHDGRLLVSNSMVFLLARTGDALDLEHPHYYFDFLRHKRRGLTRPTGSIRLASGRRLTFHQYTNVLVRSDLSLGERGKNLGRPPADFADYRDMLRSTIRRVFANAMHASRKRTYRPLATLSQGYDAPAVAALAVEAGCATALSGIRMRGPTTRNERGAIVGAHLGLETIEYDRFGYLSRTDIPEAEFCASMSFGSYVPLVSVEHELEGSMLITGHPGDDVWTTDAKKILPRHLAPSDQLLEANSVLEFRLRVGFIFFPAVWTGGSYKRELHRISVSAEMKSWSLPRRYNRPIARRLAEEAGVPRADFGQDKLATLQRNITVSEAMTAEGWSDFSAFLESRVGRAWPRRGAGVMRLVALGDEVLFQCLQRLPKRLYLRCMPMALWGFRDRADPRWRSIFLFTYHWGIARIRSRYQW
jgi:hypothetical protein